jgi:SAM-dependent methyltransferase
MTTWAVGDYPLMAERLEPAARRVVEAAGIEPSDTVLDVATGTGNAALLAAAGGAPVVGIDFEQTLLDIASRRCTSQGLAVRWVNADVGDLPVPDRSASAVLSVFGVMYAADHEVAMKELARAVAPSGRVVLASWVPGSFMPAMGPALSPFLQPTPASSGPPSLWGDAESLGELGARHVLSLTDHAVERLELGFPTAELAAEFMVMTAGHVMAERPRLVSEQRWDPLLANVNSLVETMALPAEGGIAIPCDYLVATLCPGTS